MSLKSAWEFLAALFPDDPVEANYPAIPYGQTILLGTDGLARWSDGSAAVGEILVDDASGEILIDDATGNVLYDG